MERFGRRLPRHRRQAEGGLRRLRAVLAGARRRACPAHVLRPLRPPAPGAGVGGDRHLRRRADDRLSGHGPRLAGLRRPTPGRPGGRAPRPRPRPLLHDGLRLVGERPARVRRSRRRERRRRPQRQPRQRRELEGGAGRGGLQVQLHLGHDVHRGRGGTRAGAGARGRGGGAGGDAEARRSLLGRHDLP